MENSSILLLNSSFAFLILSKRKEDEKEGRRLAEMCVYLLIFFMSLLINASVFYVVLYGKKTSRRSVSLLIAHLSVVTITWSLHGVLYTADKYEIIILRAPYLCEIWSFARNTHHAVFPLNIFGIVYERLRSFREECDGYYLIVHRAIILIWVISAAFSWPSFFAYKFEADATGEGFGTCKKIIPLGWLIAYESVRFIFLHILLCGSLAFALHSVKSKFNGSRSIIPFQNDGRRRTIRRIRFLYCYSFLFIVDWVPIGFFISIFKLLFRETLTGTETENSITNRIFIKLFQIISLLSYIYCFLNPLIYICLNENISVSYVLGCNAICKLRQFISRKRRKHAGEGKKEEVENQNVSQHQLEGESKKEEKGNCENVELALINCERRTGFGPTVAQAELELLNKQEEEVVVENHATLQDVECTETFV